MKIFLCGAKDLRKISKVFENVVTEFGCQPQCFIDTKIEYDNNESWERNSEVTVAGSDIVVFVIMGQYGSITWDVEYMETKKSGKSFLLFCERNIYKAYYSSKSQKTGIAPIGSAKRKLFSIIDELNSEHRTLVSFDIPGFGPIFKVHLLQVFRNGIQAIEERNKKRELLSFIRGKEIMVFKDPAIMASESEYLSQLLFDVFENKEVRKRILRIFTSIKGLRDDDIINLARDPEQGVARTTIELLPQLVDPNNNLDPIFQAFVDIANASSDFGIDRRVICSLLETDLILSISYLRQLFPASDIGTPRRIAEDTYDRIDTILALAKDKGFKGTFRQLMEDCKQHQKSTANYKDKIQDMLDWIDSLEGDDERVTGLGTL